MATRATAMGDLLIGRVMGSCLMPTVYRTTILADLFNRALGSLNDVAREVNAVSPKIAQKLLNTTYHPEKDYEQNPYRRSSWDSMRARL